MKTPKIIVTLFVAAILAAAIAVSTPGCGTTQLESGGAYAPTLTDTNGAPVPAQQPDAAFFIADSTFSLAYSAIDGAFEFERNNRRALWKVAPQIKRGLDKIRPEAVRVRDDYLKMRRVYMANPVPVNLTELQAALAKVQQLSLAATAILPQPNNP
jgi:hypothetical protein